MSEDDADILQFPCHFPLKVIGLVGPEEDFQNFVLEIIRRHVPYLEDEQITNRLSRGGKYMSVSVVFWAESRSQVDALYIDLGNYKNRIYMVL